MEYRFLGRTGLRVSPICLGTMNFGPRTDEAEAFAIMDRALEEGINFFDTANVYGSGKTETILGRWFAQGGERRERVVLATKVYNGRNPWPNTSRLSALHIREACEASLRRLQTDHLDLYQMHHIDRDTPWDEVWQAMELLVAQGKVVYVGSSNFAGWHLAQANEAARRRNFLGLVSEQSLYNLTERTVELEVIPAAQHYGLGILPWSPVGGGLLAGVLDGQTGERRGSESVVAKIERMRPQLEAWEKLCADLGEQPADVAVAWLLANPAVTAPIIGPRTMEQFVGSLRTLEISLTPRSSPSLMRSSPDPVGRLPRLTPGRSRFGQTVRRVVEHSVSLLGDRFTREWIDSACSQRMSTARGVGRRRAGASSSSLADMCRNITILRGLEPAATRIEIEAAARQYVRKVGGLRTTSRHTEEAFERAARKIADVTEELLAALPPRQQVPRSDPPLRRLEARKAATSGVNLVG